MSGFTGTIGVTPVWPAEMGWQGDRVNILFDLPLNTPPNLLYYAFSIDVTHKFLQIFDVAVLAGSDTNSLGQYALFEDIADPGMLVALIPACAFVTGQTNVIRIQGIGVHVGFGEDEGIRWGSWSLESVHTWDFNAVREDQISKSRAFVLDAIQPSGLVRDALPLDPSYPPFHPATPDAAAFAILGLCALDDHAVIPDARTRVKAILSAYAGHTPGVNPSRSFDGQWQHYMNPVNGSWAAGGWEFCHTTIGSALLVTAGKFAGNHFKYDPEIAALAEELFTTTHFDPAIRSDHRIYFCMNPSGGGTGSSAASWNEFMLVLSIALRQTENANAIAAAPSWLVPANLPTRDYDCQSSLLSTLTDDAASYAPAFWVQQSYYFNSDFATNTEFLTFLENQRLADQCYCEDVLLSGNRYGLTAGVVPTGGGSCTYHADEMGDHPGKTLAPEAVAAWGDWASLGAFSEPPSLPSCDARNRYGLMRVSIEQPSWVPCDAALVDHLFLLFGLVRSVHPNFFVQRQPWQTDADQDGLADAYENCPTRASGDVNGDGTINGLDIGPFTAVALNPGAADPLERCAADINGDDLVDFRDLHQFVVRLLGI